MIQRSVEVTVETIAAVFGGFWSVMYRVENVEHHGSHQDDHRGGG